MDHQLIATAFDTIFMTTSIVSLGYNAKKTTSDALLYGLTTFAAVFFSADAILNIIKQIASGAH